MAKQSLDFTKLRKRTPAAVPESFPTRPSRYAGKCARCGTRYQAGDQILWLGPGKVWCKLCCRPR